MEFKHFPRKLSRDATDRLLIQAADDSVQHIEAGDFLQGISAGGGGLQLLSSPAFAISGGDNPSFPKEKAFELNSYWDGVGWLSAQSGGAIMGTAWIGQDFGVPTEIKILSLSQSGGGVTDTNRMISSAKLQTSNGSTWTDRAVLSLSPFPGMDAVYSVLGISAQYWRIVANSNTTAFQWHIYKIRMWG